MCQTQLLQLKEENYCLDDQCKCQEKGESYFFSQNRRPVYVIKSVNANRNYSIGKMVPYSLLQENYDGTLLCIFFWTLS